MARNRVPGLRQHKGSGQGYVWLEGRRVYCGAWGRPETRARADRIVAEWLAHGRQLPPPAPEEITIAEVAARFWRHSETYYRRPDGAATSEVASLRAALRPLVALYGDLTAADFGIRQLRAVRERMIRGTAPGMRHAWTRQTINKAIGRLKGVFAWAAQESLVSGGVYHDLSALKGLKRGRCGPVRENRAIGPIAGDAVEAVLPHVSRQVRAIVRLQLLTGARGGELLHLRPRDIDKSGDVWLAALGQHKTAHHGKARTLYFGPQAREILRPFLLRSE
ncbi:MAG: tyrosine-type recombinase/integrase, partial [Planctomycetota bacterium]